ncbi:probable NADH dehydrogenase [ubiquinone] flavoprotein 2, mitochondrial [Nymphalis io]|uniref:probable NADH dehydrogenase [ubiquinone] flavoprotein 2, mitochondrial n=1 Tax=Inachis io TaxID=171585 RepID=UPI002166C527|nr:probable NADH dehydrogenase [ubiquinone] flavoprotein 2, mitochondrial [Nymphalis io]
MGLLCYADDTLLTATGRNFQEVAILAELGTSLTMDWIEMLGLKFHRLYRNISTSNYFWSEELNVHRDTKDNNAKTPFEFSDANLKRLTAIIQNYPEGFQRSATSAAMDIVQRQMGWVPISAMHKVAEVLNIPRMRIYEWATFYTMIKRRYRGKFNVKVCVTTPCMLRGADTILQVVEETTLCCAGGVSADGLFGVDIVQCQGACVNAPVIVVDDDYYEDVSEYDVHNIIQTLKCGRIPPWGPQSGRFASEPISGKTTLIENPPPPGFGIQAALFRPV